VRLPAGEGAGRWRVLESHPQPSASNQLLAGRQQHTRAPHHRAPVEGFGGAESEASHFLGGLRGEAGSTGCRSFRRR